jgi:hypothetical protein
MRSDPQAIAEQIIRDHGLEGALARAAEGTSDAQRDRDNYQLSVWREVKMILRDRRDHPGADFSSPE